MTLHLRVVSRSEVGLIRKNNQDSGYSSPHLLVVADGMGGAAAGDLASAVAIDVIKRIDTPDLLSSAESGSAQSSEASDPIGPGAGDGTEDTVVVPLTADREQGATADQGPAGRNSLLRRFADAIAEANSRIAALVAADYSLEGMGTTVTGAIFDGQRLGLAHIGDSRGYLLREGRLERLTHDHSWVQSLVDDGKISAEEAAYHPHRSLLLKVLNGQPANDPDLTTVELRAGDRLLLCSDGLSGMVDDDEIAELAANSDLDAAVDDLVDAALAAGGIDNVTVILAEAVDDGDSPATADDTAARAVVGAPAVLGAAAERRIPDLPGSSSRSAGLVADDEDEDQEDAPSASDAGDGAAPTTAGEGATADDEARYAPGPPAKRRFIRTLLIGLAVLLVTAAGLGAGYAWTRTQYFVGASAGQVAIYSGLPESIPGLSLSEVYEVQPLAVSSLPPYYQAQVAAGIEASSLEGARATVEQLKDTARRCAQPSPTPTPTLRGTAKPKPTMESKPPPRSNDPKPTTSVTAPATTPTSTASPLPGQGC